MVTGHDHNYGHGIKFLHGHDRMVVKYKRPGKTANSSLPQQIADGVQKWCIENKMRLNISKSKVMLLGHKENTPTPAVSINGQQLEVVSTYKYLLELILLLN